MALKLLVSLGIWPQLTASQACHEAVKDAVAASAAGAEAAEEGSGGQQLLQVTSREIYHPRLNSSGAVEAVLPKVNSTNAKAMVEVNATPLNTNLQFIHVPCTFGHTVEEAGVGQLDVLKISAILASDLEMLWANKAAAFATLNSVKGEGGMLWGELNPDLQAVSSETGCNLYYTPPSMWPKDVQERQLQGKQLFSMLRDPYDRMANEFRMQCQGIDSAFELLTRPAVSLREGHLEREGAEYLKYYLTCDVNGYLQSELTKYLAGDRYRGNCHLLPSAEYASSPFGEVEWVDERGIPESFNDFMTSKNASPRMTASLHNFECNDVSAWSLTEKTKKLIRQVYAEDFKLACKVFGHCDDHEM